MIHFVTPRAREFGIVNYMADYSPDLAARLEPLHYESLLERDTIPVGTYVFTAFDYLTRAEIDLVHRVREVVGKADTGAILLNDPARVLLRGPLLQALHKSGRNEFRAVPATGDLAGLRYPVFVREANWHSGSLTERLPDRRAVERALTKLRLKGYRLDDLLVLEFCDTVDERGLYAKYSAYAIGDKVVARSVAFSGEWVTKHARRLVNEEIVRIEYDYADQNPHEHWLAETFAIAGIEYGRIDYGISKGKPQVWEINLNPTVARGPGPRRNSPQREREREMRTPARNIFVARFREAWTAYDSTASGEIPWRVEESLKRAVIEQRRLRDRQRARIERRASLLRFPPVRALTHLFVRS